MATGDATIGTLTVMFTDLVGSTELRSRLGEDAAEAVRAAHDAILFDAIRANEGRVVKHLGDGLMATFTSAASAVAAGVSIQQGIDLANRRSDGERLQVRVGISVGDVTFEGDDCFGLPVVEAQRLEASAEPGTIRCAELVKHLARGRGDHEYRPLGDLTLKGLAAPIAACDIVWAPLPIAAAPLDVGLPPALMATGLPFSGRDEVLDALVGTWKHCMVGGFAAVLLAGEPGVGKTRLARELARRVHDARGLVLAGRCDEDLAVPFQAFGAALEWFVRHTPGTEVAGRLGEFPGDLARLVPHLGDLVPGLPDVLVDEPDTERQRLFHAVESWLSVGGADAPRLLVLDDLHWADKPTLLLLRQLITARPAGLMILCTYRDTDVDRTHPLSAMLADFRRMDSVTRIAVAGLGADGVRELLERTGGHDLDDEGLRFAELMHRETSGNPFFLGEVLRHLAETGALYEREGRWVSDRRPEDAGIPEGIREVVGRRLSRLGDDVEQVLRSAAVIGYEFDVDLLADVVGRDVDDVIDALDTATAANLVIEIGVDRHRFAHALVRETLHDELSSSRRARQHRKVAEAIEARHVGNLDAVVVELATHWAEASAGGDPTRAIELAIRAGDLAVERAADENGARWFASALDLLDDDDQDDGELRRRTLVKLALAQTASGSPEDGRANALRAAREAITTADIDTASDALLISARASFSESEEADPEKVALLRAALELDGLSTFQRAMLCTELATELIMERDIAGRRSAIAERDELVSRLPLADQAQVLSRVGGTSMATQTLPHGRSRLEVIRAAPLADLTPSARRRRLHAQAMVAVTVADRPAYDDAVARLERERALLPTVIDPFDHIIANNVAQVAGRIDLMASTATDLTESLTTLGSPEVTVYRTTTALALEREVGGLGSMDWVADITATMGHPASPARAIAGFIRLHQGAVDAAIAALDETDGHEFADDAGYPINIAYWSEVSAAVGSDAQRRRFLGLLAPHAGLFTGTGGLCLGPIDRLSALLHDALGEHERADELFAAAANQMEQMAAPSWLARTQLDWAESLLARGKTHRADELVAAAAAAIGELDLPDTRARISAIAPRH